MNVNLQALIIPVIVLGLLLFVTRWAFRPRQARVDPAANFDVIAAGIPLDDAMELRATLGAADIETAMTVRREGDMEVWVFHEDLAAARALLDA